MNRFELRDALLAAGVRTDAFSIDDGLVNDTYCLAATPDGRWQVYYTERGEISILGDFDDEGEACAFMFNPLCAEPMVRVDYVPDFPPPW
jgi:hypothetical protein